MLSALYCAQKLTVISDCTGLVSRKKESKAAMRDLLSIKKGVEVAGFHQHQPCSAYFLIWDNVVATWLPNLTNPNLTNLDCKLT